MVIKKADWRAFETVAEPGDPSTFVWLGRSTPVQWFFKNRWPIPRGISDGILGPYNPVFDPIIVLADRPYAVTYNGVTIHTLAWDSTRTIDGHTYRFVIQQWVDAQGTWCAFNWREGDHNDLCLGLRTDYQHDARKVEIRLRSYATYLGSGVISNVTWNGNAHQANLDADGPPWFTGGGILDMLNDAVPTSIILNWS